MLLVQAVSGNQAAAQAAAAAAAANAEITIIIANLGLMQLPVFLLCTGHKC